MEYVIYSNRIKGYVKDLILDGNDLCLRYTKDINNAYFSSYEDCEGMIQRMRITNVEIQEKK